MGLQKIGWAIAGVFCIAGLAKPVLEVGTTVFVIRDNNVLGRTHRARVVGTTRAPRAFRGTHARGRCDGDVCWYTALCCWACDRPQCLYNVEYFDGGAEDHVPLERIRTAQDAAPAAE